MELQPRFVVGCQVVFVCLAVVLYLLFRRRHRSVKNFHARRVAARLEVYVAGAALWPALVLHLCHSGAAGSRCSWLYLFAGALVLAYLTQEVSALSNYSGPLCEFDHSDLFYQRSTQISTVAFAVGTLLVSQKDEELARRVTPLVFLALALCVFSSVPSASARNRPKANASINALQKLTVSYSAGILCLAVVFCLTTKL